MKNVALMVLVVALVGGGYYMMTMQKQANPAMEQTVPEGMMESDAPAGEKKEMEESKPEAMMEKGAVKEFTVDSFEMGFSVKTMTVKKGDTVKITLTNSGKYTHDWVVDEFNARTKVIKNGETDMITFVADKVGTFEYYCSVMQHRKQGMVGKLMVE